jgi:hypothetical protein
MSSLSFTGKLDWAVKRGPVMGLPYGLTLAYPFGIPHGPWGG